MTRTVLPERVRAMVESGLLSVPEACAFLGIKKSLLYNLMARGELAYTRVGTRRLIPREALIELAARNMTGVGDAEAK